MIPLLTPQTGPPSVAEEPEVLPNQGDSAGVPFLAVMAEGDEIPVLSIAQRHAVETEVLQEEIVPPKGEVEALPDTLAVAEGPISQVQATAATRAGNAPMEQRLPTTKAGTDPATVLTKPEADTVTTPVPVVRSPAQRFIEGTMQASPAVPDSAVPPKTPPLPAIEQVAAASQIKFPMAPEAMQKSTRPAITPEIARKVMPQAADIQGGERHKDVPKPMTPAPDVVVRNTPMHVAPKALAAVSMQPVLATALQDIETFKLQVEPDLAVVPLSQDRTAPTTQMAQTAPFNSAHTARYVAQQIAVSVTQGSGGTTEIALRPQELGNVRLALSASETTVNVVILAERPETQDLLRRHIDTLAQEFKALGYDNISFSFEGRDQPHVPSGDASDADEASTAEIDQPADIAPQMTPKSGLDLRL